MQRLLIAIAFLLGLAAGATAQTTIPAGTYTDLGAGAVQLTNLAAVPVSVCIATAQPSADRVCQPISAGGAPTIFNSGQHLWAMPMGQSSVSVLVEPIAVPSVSDAQNAGYQGAVAMTIGTTYAARRSVKANCTAIGNVSLTLADGSTDVWIISAAGSTVIPYAATAINSSGTTATCTYSNLK
jgi:hypothetical protein